MATTMQTVDLDGFSYQITQLPARRATRLFNRLVRGVGPGLAMLLGDAVASGSFSLADLNVLALAPALREAFDRLPDAEIDAIMDELFSTVRVVTKGESLELSKIFDAHFQGRTVAVYKLLWEALKTNYSDFSDALAAVALPSRAQSPSAE